MRNYVDLQRLGMRRWTASTFRTQDVLALKDRSSGCCQILLWRFSVLRSLRRSPMSDIPTRSFRKHAGDEQGYASIRDVAEKGENEALAHSSASETQGVRIISSGKTPQCFANFSESQFVVLVAP